MWPAGDTFPKCQDLRRHVKRGEKAITLCMPVTVKRKEKDESGEEQDASFTTFVYKARWFGASRSRKLTVTVRVSKEAIDRY